MIKQQEKNNNHNPEMDLRQRGEIFRLFNRIARKYDITNHLLSFGQDAHWRRELVRQIQIEKGQDFFLLDLATGTGEVIKTFREFFPDLGCVIGIDLSVGMIREGMEKLPNNTQKHLFAVMDVLYPGIKSETINVVTMAFGIRNVSEVSLSLKEIYRVLKPGGQVLILEFGLPQKGLWRTIYLFYLRYLLPYIGGFWTGCPSAYRYLSETICKFPSHNHFSLLLEEVGFTNAKWTEFNRGAVLLYTASKPGKSE
ncbi:MAG: ubiquinone/menaquinone biosynthesis methyltransferase [Candidatus Hydrogenedens sp.]